RHRRRDRHRDGRGLAEPTQRGVVTPDAETSRGFLARPRRRLGHPHAPSLPKICPTTYLVCLGIPSELRNIRLPTPSFSPAVARRVTQRPRVSSRSCTLPVSGCSDPHHCAAPSRRRCCWSWSAS